FTPSLAQRTKRSQQAGEQCKSHVCHSCFAKALQRRPELNLYAADRRHPTLAGTYLAACMVYASLLKKSPVGFLQFAHERGACSRGRVCSFFVPSRRSRGRAALRAPCCPT